MPRGSIVVASIGIKSTWYIVYNISQRSTVIVSQDRLFSEKVTLHIRKVGLVRLWLLWVVFHNLSTIRISSGIIDICQLRPINEIFLIRWFVFHNSVRWLPSKIYVLPRIANPIWETSPVEGKETKKCIILKNNFHSFVVQKTLHVANKNVLPVTIVDNQRICRNFHQACYDEIEVNATTEFSYTHCKTEVDDTIHVPEKNMIIHEKKKENQQKEKKKEGRKFIMDWQVLR